MEPPVLDRPPTAPAVAPPGPPNADGYPTTNARGQIRGPGPRYEPEVIDALKRRIAKDMAKVAAAEAAEATDAEVSAGTAAGVDEIPVVGWGVVAVEGGVAIYQGVQLYRALKDLKEAQEELKRAEEAEEKNKSDPKKNVAVEGQKPCPKPLVIQFDLNGYDKAAFDHQLRMQQDKIMQKGACKDYDDIDKFDNKSPATKKADRRAADKVGQGIRDSYEAQHGLGSADNLAALHRLDMVAGGDPLDLAEMGDKGVNSSIGPQWNGTARKPALKAYAKEICDSKGRCPFSVTLTAK